MAHGISRSLMGFLTFSQTLTQKHRQIPTHYNAKYQSQTSYDA
ncbi:hypothetical protein [Candidatus Bathycorpusculum sp.]